MANNSMDEFQAWMLRMESYLGHELPLADRLKVWKDDYQFALTLAICGCPWSEIRELVLPPGRDWRHEQKRALGPMLIEIDEALSAMAIERSREQKVCGSLTTAAVSKLLEQLGVKVEASTVTCKTDVAALLTASMNRRPVDDHRMGTSDSLTHRN